MGENKLEEAFEIARKEGLTSVEEPVMKAIERALKEGASQERSLMACGHPRACLWPSIGSACSACAQMNGLESILLKARGSTICRNFPEVLGLLDEALAKLFRPAALKGKA